MKLIIPAAGKGTRFYPLTKDRPKLLVELDGKTALLGKQMQIFAESGVIDKAVYVVGYRAEMIEDKLAELSGRLNIATETVFNSVYDMANNLISLWLARQEFDEDAVITNGDNLFFRKPFTYFLRILDYVSRR